MKWKRNPGVWLARCYAGVLSSLFAVAVGDNKTSLADSNMWVYFFLFTVWKSNAGLKYWEQGLAEQGLAEQGVNGK